jgi:DNA-binding HxlR family transcriptional regulator
MTLATTGKLSAKMRRGDLFACACPSRDVLKHVTSRWGVLVLVALMEGTHRFSDLRRKVGGVSEKMLAQTLQYLEKDGFINRVSLPVVPPHVEYSLTPLGMEIGKQVGSLADWIETNLPKIMKSQQKRLAE